LKEQVQNQFEADVNDDAYSVTIDIRKNGSLTQSSVYLGGLFLLALIVVAPQKRMSKSTRNAVRLSLALLLCLLAF
jgi:hypothetical protein